MYCKCLITPGICTNELVEVPVDCNVMEKLIRRYMFQDAFLLTLLTYW